MKSLKLFPFLFLLAACTGGAPKYDATGTFEATEVIVSAEASGRLLSFDIEEGTTLKDGQEVGIIDTVQLYLKKLQLEASVKSVEGQRPDILKQVAATQEQIVQARRERDRVSNHAPSWVAANQASKLDGLPQSLPRSPPQAARRPETPPCATATAASLGKVPPSASRWRR